MFSSLRTQFLTFWQKLGRTQRTLTLALVITLLIVVPIIFTWANTPTYTVAFSGLSESSAGQIVEKLTEANTPYQLRDVGTILVPSDQVYEVRLQMAREGLPQGDTVGYELFTTSSTLGMTDFTQKVTYQRALEGELERTINSLDAIADVRVHIVTPEKTLFQEDQAATTASVTLQVAPGSTLDAAQIQSITHLVASSVEGLRPENVVIVDVEGNLLAGGPADAEQTASVSADSRRAAELTLAAEIQRKVQKLLDSSLGPNRSVVQAYVTLDWTQRETTSQAFDPEASAIRSSQVLTESYATDGDLIGGIPGAETNLPPAVVSETLGTNTVYYHRQEQTHNYEITQVETHEVETPGTVERITLSVLLDGVDDPTQLASLQAAIAAAAGIDPARGDQLAVESLTFDHTYADEQAADLTAQQQQELYFRIGQIVAAALLLLLIFLYINRMLTNLRRTSAQSWVPVMRPVAELTAPAGVSAASLPAPTMSIPTPATISGSAAAAYKPAQPAAPAQPEEDELPLPGDLMVTAPSSEVERLQRFVNRMAEESPAKVAEIIQFWLSEEK
ncbi:MAG: flagellar M-ring protein FliF [Anaerolineales bacterium]|nr:flagellar M-ring protein FliF [Anaerolineales bacterium]